jgi:hypothetical protein
VPEGREFGFWPDDPDQRYLDVANDMADARRDARVIVEGCLAQMPDLVCMAGESSKWGQQLQQLAAEYGVIGQSRSTV